MSRSTVVVIPTTIKKATAQLASLDKVATATEWERAAIVAAFVREGGGRGRSPELGTYSIARFAALKITGLRSPETVRLYVERWDEFYTERPEPGDEVSLGDVPWTSLWVDTVHAQSNNSASELRNPDKITKRMRKDPEVFAAVTQAIAEHRDMREEVHVRAQAVSSGHYTPKGDRRVKPLNPESDLARAMRDAERRPIKRAEGVATWLVETAEEIERGRITFDADERRMIEAGLDRMTTALMAVDLR